MWTIFKVFIEFVTILLLFHVLVFFWPRGMQDLSSPTRERTLTPCIIGRRSLNHWTAREGLKETLFKPLFSCVQLNLTPGDIKSGQARQYQYKSCFKVKQVYFCYRNRLCPGPCPQVHSQSKGIKKLEVVISKLVLRCPHS